MMVSLLTFAAAAASSHSCHSDTIGRVFKDSDPAEPFALVTTAGQTFRLAGQDFIHPRSWHLGDKLEICAQPGPGSWVEITNTSRSEKLIGQRR